MPVKKKIDNTIYTFDIETTSYIILNNKIYNSFEYDNLSKNEQENSIKQSFMYIWQFSINETVYYGRTWDEFREFIDRINENDNTRKIVFVHNLSFEFQFLYSNLRIKSVMSRKSRKLLSFELEDYDIQFRCSYQLSNLKLEKLSDVYQLDVSKKTGDLDYYKIRTPNTQLTEDELNYCEYDCLVVYKYILKELEIYERVDKLPITSTGKVRKELQKKVLSNYSYVHKVSKQINTNPVIYNMLIDAFAGGYTHSNYIYTDEILNNVDSYDETSAYPYVLVTEKFPSSEFKPCCVRKKEDLLKNFAYLLNVTFYNIKTKYFNSFISASKCSNIEGRPQYDNGRIRYADSITINCTDIDFKFILDTHEFSSYKINKSYYSIYQYLPLDYVTFILNKYKNKTQLKNVNGRELEYAREKGAFNSLYGMTVTNTIRDEVSFINYDEWSEARLSNEEISERLFKEKKKGFLNFAWGVWCTAYARDNLLRRVIELDESVVYCDTDSIKLVQGYNKNIFSIYNKQVENKILSVCKARKLDFNLFNPTDISNIKHMLGVFECETLKNHKYTYDSFITQGAKKYAYETNNKISVVVSGVPKNGSKCLKKLNDFRDGMIFDFKTTNKLTLSYNDNQIPFLVTDYLGNDYYVKDKSGICLLPTTYKLGKSTDYTEFIKDQSSERAKFNL